MIQTWNWVNRQLQATVEWNPELPDVLETGLLRPWKRPAGHRRPHQKRRRLL